MFEFLSFLEGTPTNITGERLVFGMGPPHMAVMSSVRSEGLSAVFALERAFAGMLPDVSSKDAGRSEGLWKSPVS